MQADGLSVNYEILNDDDYVAALKDKMQEELQELMEASSTEELKLELVDVMEVMEHLVSVYGFDKKELEEIKVQKQAKLGAFDKRIKTHSVEMPDNHPDVDYYLSKSHKYPEIL